ncbi:hypothetical protein TIFTF001_006033 [Ficus carica]|uniref:Uncharacterized protein n=1 Tax=Ficus carica TaxID=3494 RepID=A0AA87ZZL1_FICCA|nr:hypothetical protein TIFTF001_006033 [Ficus carica]
MAQRGGPSQRRVANLGCQSNNCCIGACGQTRHIVVALPQLNSSIASKGRDSGRRSWILRWRLKTQTVTDERREEREG